MSFFAHHTPWPTKRFDEVLKIRKGSIDPRSRPSEVFDLFSIPAFDEGNGPENQLGRAIGSSKTVVETEDCLFSKLNPRIPRTWVIPPTNGNRQICSTEFWPIRSRFSMNHEYYLDPIFLKWLFQFKMFLDEFRGNVSGGVQSRQRLKQDDLLTAIVPIPPLDEQRRIVARIEELTHRAEEARKLRQEAVAKIATQFFHVRRNIYQSLLSDFPATPLGKCGKVMGGGTPSKQHSDFWDGDIPWVSAKDMKTFFLTGSGLKITEKGFSESSVKLIPENSVLFVVRGSILYRHVPIAINLIPCTINQDLKAIIPSKDINAVYLAHMLWAANDILLGMVEEAGNTAGKLPTPSWSGLEIPIPDESKQEQVVQELTTFQEKLAELESLQTETAKELEHFQSALLAKAFRGEL